MSYYDNAKAIENKIGTALAEEGLVYTLHTKSYPAMLIISQSQSPAAQMDFLAGAEDGGVSSKDSALRFIFEMDGITVHAENRLIITDAFMTKLKGLAKKWHSAYCHAYFADHIQTNSGNGETEVVENADDETGVVDGESEIVEDVEIPAIDPAAIEALGGVEDDPFDEFMAQPDEPGNA